MKRVFGVFAFAVLLSAGNTFAQESATLNTNQALLDRLDSCVRQSIDTWKSHADIPHPEDAELDDKDWPTLKTGEEWKTGPRVLRTRIQIPQTLHGYNLQGARVRLALGVDSNDFVTITVFSNGSMVSRTPAAISRFFSGSWLATSDSSQFRRAPSSGFT